MRTALQNHRARLRHAHKRGTRDYHYRGNVRLAPFDGPWRHGYSATPTEPLMTREACQADAKRDGLVAVFYLDGKVLYSGDRP